MCDKKVHRVYKQTEIINNKRIIERVEKEFVSPTHREAIENASIDGMFVASFRAAGKHTLARLIDGAAAKGHDIMEKSIKESSLQKYYRDKVYCDKIYNMLKENDLLGVVGKWNSNGLIGIYISKSGVTGAEFVKENIYTYPIDLSSRENLSRSLINLKKVEFWKRCVYTGDYDLHDLITLKSGRPRTVLVGNIDVQYGPQSEEHKIIALINEKISQVDTLRVAGTHKVIQHGPQVNYVSYAREHEDSRSFIASVASPGEFPVAVVKKGVWKIVEDIHELNVLYTEIGAVIKSAWSEDGARIYKEDPLNPGYVTPARRC